MEKVGKMNLYIYGLQVWTESWVSTTKDVVSGTPFFFLSSFD